MGVNMEYAPTAEEKDAMGELWARSGGLFSVPQARVAWIAKNFVDRYPRAKLRVVHAWLEKNHVSMGI